jgi:hypothetical protein
MVFGDRLFQKPHEGTIGKTGVVMKIGSVSVETAGWQAWWQGLWCDSTSQALESTLWGKGYQQVYMPVDTNKVYMCM